LKELYSMQIARDFSEKKEKLIRLLEKLKTSEFIPSSEIRGPEEIERFIEDFKKAVFTIGVCGQIKSGKSTLLNYILFEGKNVLPTDVNPCTDTLTHIRYGEENKVTVYFYTQKEWEELKKLKIIVEGQEVNYFEKYLKPEVDKRANENGLFPEKILGQKKELTGSINDLANFLIDYVSAEGIYTPFVSHVEIMLNNRFIKDVVIVDTPGLNDPNELRSSKTQEFMKNATAVIYLLYVGRAMDKNDYDFIDRVLTFVESEKIMLAVSKIDTHEDYATAVNYVKEVLSKDENLISKGFKKELLLLYPISVMAATISKKQKAGIPLTEEEKYHLNRISPELIEKQGLIKDFISALDKVLMREKGNAIVAKCKKYIIGVCDAKIEDLNFEVEKIKTKIALYAKDLNEIREKIEILRKKSDKLRKQEVAVKKDLEHCMNEISNIVERKLREQITNKVEKKIQDWIDQSNVNEVVTSLQRKLYGEFENNIFSYGFYEEGIKKDIEHYLDNFIDKEVAKIREILTYEIFLLISPGFSVKLGDLLKICKVEIKKKLLPEELKKLKKKEWLVLTNEEETKENIKNQLSEAIDNIREKLLNHLANRAWGELKNNFVDYHDKIKEALNNILRDLENIERNYKNREHEVNKLQDEKKETEEKIETLKREKEKLQIEIENI